MYVWQTHWILKFWLNSDNISKKWNSERIQTFCQKSKFTKNEVRKSKTIHFQIKMTNSNKMDRLLAEFLATILLLNSADFYWCQIVWIQQRNPKSFWSLSWIICELGYCTIEVFLTTFFLLPKALCGGIMNKDMNNWIQ